MSRKKTNLYDENIAKNIIVPMYNELEMTKQLLRFFSGPRGQHAKWVGNCIVVKTKYRIFVDFWEQKANEIIQTFTDKYWLHFNHEYSKNKTFFYEFCLHET